MRRDPTEFRARFNAYKKGKMPYNAGRPVAIQEVDKSDADFAKRLRSNWRLEIWDWEGSGKAVTHKIGSSDNIVYPNVQTTEGGGLIDFTNPIWKGVVDPRQRAILHGDFVPMKTESDAIWFGPNYKKYYPGFKNGKLPYNTGLPKFAEGTGGVENNITEEYAPIVSNTYQPTIDKLKLLTVDFNVDDYVYVAKKQHPEITREQVLAAYNNTPYVASNSSVGNTYGLYRHGEDDGYGRGVVIYPKRMRPDGPDFNLEDRIKSNMFHENHHGLRDMLFGGEYTDEERRYLELLAPGSKDYNEIGARVRQARGNMNIEMGRTGKKLDDDVDKMSLRDSKFHYTKVMKSMGITDWNPEIDKAFRWALKNVASTQIRPRQGLLLAKDGKLPEYGGGKIPITTGGTGVIAPQFYGTMPKEALSTANTLELIANFMPYVGTIQDVLEVVDGNLAKTPSAIIGGVADIALPGIRTAWRGIKAAKTAIQNTPKIVDKIKNYKLLQKLQKRFAANIAYLGIGTYLDILDNQGYIKSTK